MASFSGWMRFGGPGLVAAAALLTGGCDDSASRSTAKVTLGGRAFFLELAIDGETRFRGLSERTHIEEDGGMLFVFPASQVQVHGFVMRDCPIPIDIVYLDSAGRIVAFHEMKPLPPRAVDGSEGRAGPEARFVDRRDNKKYEDRLVQYSSRFPTQFVIELKGGTIAPLKLKEGDKVEFDVEGLKKRAR